MRRSLFAPIAFVAAALFAALGRAAWIEGLRDTTGSGAPRQVAPLGTQQADESGVLNEPPAALKVFLGDSDDIPRLISAGFDELEKRGDDFVG